MKKNYTKKVASVLAVMSLVACGGGDGGGSGVDTSPLKLQIDTTCGINNFQAEMLAMVNAMRSSGAVCGGISYPSVGALGWNEKLKDAATLSSYDNAKTGKKSHVGTDGSNVASRASAVGYSGGVGENIYWGYNSVASSMSWWMNSAAHCSNIMRADYYALGASCVQGNDGYSHFTQVFGN